MIRAPLSRNRREPLFATRTGTKISLCIDHREQETGVFPQRTPSDRVLRKRRPHPIAEIHQIQPLVHGIAAETGYTLVLPAKNTDEGGR